MFLNGSLENFSVTDILQLLSFSRQTGGLYIEGEVTATLYLADGEAYFADTDRSPSLEDLLIARGLSPEAWAEAVTQAPEGPVDEWLLQQGLVDAGVLADVTYGAISTALFELFRMPRDGTFDFRAGERHLSGSSQRFNVDDLTAEARDRVAEWEAIAETISSPTKLLHVPAELPYDRVQITLDACQWNALLTAARRSSFTLASLAEEIGASEADAARALNPLIGAGLVAVLEEGEQVEVGDFDEAGAASEITDILDAENREPFTSEDDFGWPGDEEPVAEPDFAAPEVGSFPVEGEVPELIDSDTESDEEGAPTAEGDPEGYELAVPHGAVETDFSIPETEPAPGEVAAGTAGEETLSWEAATAHPPLPGVWDPPPSETPEPEAADRQEPADDIEESLVADESLAGPAPAGDAHDETHWETGEWASSPDYRVISEESLEDSEDPLAGLELTNDPLDATDFLELNDPDLADWAPRSDETGDDSQEHTAASDTNASSPVDEWDAAMGNDEATATAEPEVSSGWDLNRWSVEPVSESEQEVTPSAFEWDVPEEAEGADPLQDVEAGAEPPAVQSDEPFVPRVEDSPAEVPTATTQDPAATEDRGAQEDQAPTEDQAAQEDREPDYGVAGFRTVALQELRDLAGTGAPPPPTPPRTSPRRSPDATAPKPSPEAAAPKVRALRRIIAAVRGL